MPDITVIIRVFYTIQNFFYCIKLIRAKNHQALVTLMQNDVFANNFSQSTFVKKHGGKLLQVIKRHIGSIRPVERKLIAAIRIVGKIASIHAIGYDKQLDIVKQAMKRSFVITLYLVVCLLQFHAPTLQFYLNQRQTVDEYRHVITALLSTFHRNLVGNLKLVLAPMSAIQEFHPQTFSAFQLKWKEVTKFLSLFKTGTTFEIDLYLLKFRLGKFSSTQLFQFLLIVFLQLFLKIGRQVLFLFNMNILVVHFLESIYKSIFQGSFTLYRHILSFYRYT